MFPTLLRLMLCLLVSLAISGCGKKENAAVEARGNGMKPLSERVKERKARSEAEGDTQPQAMPRQQAEEVVSLADARPIGDLAKAAGEFERDLAPIPGESAAENAARRYFVTIQHYHRLELMVDDYKRDARMGVKEAKDHQHEVNQGLKAETPENRARYEAMMDELTNEVIDITLGTGTAASQGSDREAAFQAMEKLLERKYEDGAVYLNAHQKVYLMKHLENKAGSYGAGMLGRHKGLVTLAKMEYDRQPAATMEPYLDKFREHTLKLATMEREMAEAALVDRKAVEKGSGATLQKPIARKKLEAALAKSFAEFMAE